MLLLGTRRMRMLPSKESRLYFGRAILNSTSGPISK